MSDGPPPGYAARPVEGGFETLIGPIYTRREGGGYACAFRADERHLNRRGVVHGGMLVSFADHTLGMIVWEAAGRQPCATVKLDTEFLAGARAGDWLECCGRITRDSRALVFIRGEVSCAGRTLMTMSGIWKKLGVP